MPDWTDLTVIFCMVLVVLGAVSLSVAAQSFTIVSGKVVEKGIGVLNSGGKPRLTNTISVLIENDDRVYNIKVGTVVQYPISELEVGLVDVGSKIQLFVSSYSTTARLLNHPSGNPV